MSPIRDLIIYLNHSEKNHLKNEYIPFVQTKQIISIAYTYTNNNNYKRNHTYNKYHYK